MRSWRQIRRAVHSLTCNNPKVPLKATELARSDCAALLSHRAVVKVQGDDASQLLQGLVTADVLSAAPSLYSMMLNPQGRVLYDIILYKTSESGYLLECDNRAADEVVRHLEKYALRSKVKISQAASEYDVWSLFPGTPSEPSTEGTVIYHSDPRLSELGTRVLTHSGVKVTEVWKNVVEKPLDDYHKFRLQHGIAEGVDEIPPGNCFPLEYNLDYLNGVSFQKGCYLGQELTARTHHTGVIRKRVMPITLEESLADNVLPAATITSNSGRNVGKFICNYGIFGLALLRVQQVLDVNVSLSVKTSDEQHVNIATKKPSWWPL